MKVVMAELCCQSALSGSSFWMSGCDTSGMEKRGQVAAPKRPRRTEKEKAAATRHAAVMRNATGGRTVPRHCFMSHNAIGR